jgi:N-acetyltransferase
MTEQPDSIVGAPTLAGRYVRLEPLTQAHADGIEAAVASVDRSSFAWAPVPGGGRPGEPPQTASATIAERLDQAKNGTWMPFAQVRVADDAVVGMTNFLNIERWNGAGTTPTSVEIGGTWLSPIAQRTPINTEAKLLLLTHAFEVWSVVRVQIKTDERNDKSRAAILRLGATFEGVLRNYQMGNGDLGSGAPRNTAMYSITKAEWQQVKMGLTAKLT